MQLSSTTDLEEPRLTSRRIDEFVGICRSLASKACLVEDDVVDLDTWLEANSKIQDEALVADVVRVLDAAFKNRSDAASRDELHQAIISYVGGTDPASAAATTLPFDDLDEEIYFDGEHFCLTGKFDFGTRNEVTAAIESRGGIVSDTVTAETEVLVVGTSVSPGWKHSSYGNKIKKAISMKAEGLTIIVSEAHWKAELLKTAPLDEAELRRRPQRRKTPVSQKRSQTLRPPNKAHFERGELRDAIDNSGFIASSESYLNPRPVSRVAIPWYVWLIAVFALSFFSVLSLG